MEISSDKDLLQALGFSQSEAAKILGRSRTALSQAGLLKRRDYFKAEDIQSLIRAALIRSPKLDLLHVYNYVLITRGSSVLVDMAPKEICESNVGCFKEYKVLWFVVPDVLHLIRRTPQVLEFFNSLLLVERTDICFFIGQDGFEILVPSIFPNIPASVIQESAFFRAIPAMVIGDPDDVADCYLFTKEMFVQQLRSPQNGNRLVSLLRVLTDKSVEEILERELLIHSKIF